MPRPLSTIVGLGHSKRSREPIGSARTLAADAVRAAIADSGIQTQDIDGLLLNQSSLAPVGTLPLQLMDDIGLKDLNLLSLVESKGASVLQMLQTASFAIAQGAASAVACVFADAPVGGSTTGAAAFNNEAPMTGIEGWEKQYGVQGPVMSYALAAQRYLHDYNLDTCALGHYAIACREWARLNPVASFPDPLTLQSYLESRVIAEPLRLLDCAYPVNGGIAIIVTRPELGPDLRQPPVFVHGIAQAHVTVERLAAKTASISAGQLAAARLYEQVGIAPGNVSQCQFYDAFSICALLALEDHGFCRRGEASEMIASGATGPQGHLPLNTGGGHLADAYLQGMTPLAEAITQARGVAGARQRNADAVLVNGSGGRLEFHAAALLSPHMVLR